MFEVPSLPRRARSSSAVRRGRASSRALAMLSRARAGRLGRSLSSICLPKCEALSGGAALTPRGSKACPADACVAAPIPLFARPHRRQRRAPSSHSPHQPRGLLRPVAGAIVGVTPCPDVTPPAASVAPRHSRATTSYLVPPPDAHAFRPQPPRPHHLRKPTRVARQLQPRACDSARVPTPRLSPSLPSDTCPPPPLSSRYDAPAPAPGTRAPLDRLAGRWRWRIAMLPPPTPLPHRHLSLLLPHPTSPPLPLSRSPCPGHHISLANGRLQTAGGMSKLIEPCHEHDAKAPTHSRRPQTPPACARNQRPPPHPLSSPTHVDFTMASECGCLFWYLATRATWEGLRRRGLQECNTGCDRYSSPPAERAGCLRRGTYGTRRWSWRVGGAGRRRAESRG